MRRVEAGGGVLIPRGIVFAPIGICAAIFARRGPTSRQPPAKHIVPDMHPHRSARGCNLSFRNSGILQQPSLSNNQLFISEFDLCRTLEAS